ncbi:MAG: hypothetical protein AB7F74_00215 [Parvibaculaceae bacterium]
MPFQFGLLDPNFNPYNPTPEEDLHNYLYKIGLNTFLAINEMAGRWPTKKEQRVVANRVPEAWAAGLRDERQIIAYVIKGIPSLNVKAN